MSFWDVMWFIFVSFAFLAYLMMLFQIIGDIFRDRELSGVVKAVWMFALIFVPFLTALIYLISRGRGMAERQVRTMEDVQAQQKDYIRSVAGTGASPSEEITKAKALLDAGAITKPSTTPSSSRSWLLGRGCTCGEGERHDDLLPGPARRPGHVLDPGRTVAKPANGPPG